MSANTNVDRISLEERIKALEARSPVNGGNMAFDMPSAQEWENAQPNAMTDIGRGWILRLDIPNTSTTPGVASSTSRNMRLHWGYFFPKVNGIIFGPTVFIVMFGRVTSSTVTQLNGTWAGHTTFNWGNLFTSLPWSYTGGAFARFINLSFWFKDTNNLYNQTPFQGSINPLTNDQTKASWTTSGLGIFDTKPQQYVFGVFFFPFPRSFGESYLGSSNPGHYAGGTPRMQLGQTVTTPQQLDNDLKRYYPASWYA